MLLLQRQRFPVLIVPQLRNQIISIEETMSRQSGQTTTYRGLSAAHETDQDNVG